MNNTGNWFSLVKVILKNVNQKALQALSVH